MKVHCDSCGFDGNIWRGLVPHEGKNIECPLCRSQIFIPGDDEAAHDEAADSSSLATDDLAWPSDEPKQEKKPLPLFDGLPMTPQVGGGAGEREGIAPRTAADASSPIPAEQEITEISWVSGRASLVAPEPADAETASVRPEEVESPPVTTRLVKSLSGCLGDVWRSVSGRLGETGRFVSERMGKTVTTRILLLVAVVVSLLFLGIGYLGSLVRVKMDAQALSEEYRERADVKDEEMDYIKAAESYAVSIYIDPTNYKSLNNMASMYLQIHRYDDAIELLDEAISIIETDDVAVSYANRGLAYLGLGDHDRALEDLNTAVAILPELSYAYTARGFCYLDMDEHEKALMEFETACDLGDRNGCMLYEEHSVDIDD